MHPNNPPFINIPAFNGGKKVNLAIVGATGLVGRTALTLLEQRAFPINKLFLFASQKSDGKTLPFNGNLIRVDKLDENSLDNKTIDIAIFCAGATVSEKYAPLFARRGIIVVDNSSKWRTYPSVPLIVPEVNSPAIENHHNIIANPNCSTIQAVMALCPLHRKYKLKRVIYTTFQAVSGVGQKGCDCLSADFTEQNCVFPRQIKHNVIPEIGKMTTDGNSEEENKMIFETKKILGDNSIKIAATCVRVPIFFGHCISITAIFRNKITLGNAKNELTAFPGIKIFDNCSPTPLDAAGHDDVLVGRIRPAFGSNKALNLWVVADNVRKGAATNAVQIAELFATKYFT